MRFSDVVHAVDCAENGSVYVVHVDSTQLVELAHANKVVRRYAQEEEEGLATQLADQLRYAHFRIVTSILPFQSDELGLLVIAENIDSLRGQLTVGTELHHEANRACEAILDLLASESNPLGDMVIELLSDVPQEDRLLALANNQYVVATAAYLQAEGSPSRVVTATSLHGIRAVDNLICVGSPTTSFFPEASWTTPMADSTCFVHYSMGWRRPRVEGLFAGGSPIKRPDLIESGDSRMFRDVEPFHFAETQKEAVQRAVLRHVTTGGEEIEAFLIALAGGWAVWTQADDRNQMLCVDADHSERPLITKKPARSIVPGDFLVLRLGSSNSDFIKALADERFDAAAERPKQRRWKLAFEAALEAMGGIEMARNELTAREISTANLRYWLGPKCISPQKQADFERVCAFSGIDQESGDLWQSMRSIHKAHLKAGQHVRRELEKNLLGGGITQLVDSGFQEYVLEDFGTLAAFQVQFVSTDRAIISTSAIDQPFVAEEGGWPG